jgi:hypothetical protein
MNFVWPSASRGKRERAMQIPAPPVAALRGASDSETKTKSVRGMAGNVIVCEHVLGHFS